jgi:hypothetical protein
MVATFEGVMTDVMSSLATGAYSFGAPLRVNG